MVVFIYSSRYVFIPDMISSKDSTQDKEKEKEKGSGSGDSEGSDDRKAHRLRKERRKHRRRLRNRASKVQKSYPELDRKVIESVRDRRKVGFM